MTIRKLVLGAVAIALSISGQSVSKETYDFNYIGQPLADPLLQHSKETYVLFGCAYCHGLNLVSRGEATDLMHSRLVGRDVNGNLIGPLLRAGIPQTAKLSPMPQFSDLSDQQIGALARWMHYARQEGRFKELTEAKNGPKGTASAGKMYFDQNCASCHTANDLSKATTKYDSAVLRTQILHPKGIDTPVSYKVDRLKDTKFAEGRERHLHLLENYSAEDVANLTAYAQSLK
ncbi:MAG: c-type cytochrome [Bryobacteraceae bacterium]